MAQHCTTTTTARPVEMMMVIIIILLWVVKGHKKDFRSLARRLSRFSFFSVTISVVVLAAAAAVVWSLTDWPWRYAAPSSIKVLTTFSLRSRWQTHVICPMQAGRQAAGEYYAAAQFCFLVTKDHAKCTPLRKEKKELSMRHGTQNGRGISVQSRWWLSTRKFHFSVVVFCCCSAFVLFSHSSLSTSHRGRRGAYLCVSWHLNSSESLSRSRRSSVKFLKKDDRDPLRFLPCCPSVLQLQLRSLYHHHSPPLYGLLSSLSVCLSACVCVSCSYKEDEQLSVSKWMLPQQHSLFCSPRIIITFCIYSCLLQSHLKLSAKFNSYSFFSLIKILDLW